MPLHFAAVYKFITIAIETVDVDVEAATAVEPTGKNRLSHLIWTCVFIHYNLPSVVFSQ